MRRANDAGVDLARKREIVGEGAAARQETVVLLARQGLSNPLLQAVGRIN
jgi:hypothetical protein